VPEAKRLLDGPSLVPAAWNSDPLVAEMGIRLVFSALVDADHLDTAAHFADLAQPRVDDPVDMRQLVERFERNRARLLSDRVPSPIDSVRESLYEEVVGKASLPTGVYRLPGPTGSGKTMASAGFGLHHAAAHKKSRVIVAVPFTTITEQNARCIGAFSDRTWCLSITPTWNSMVVGCVSARRTGMRRSW
jgi:CRISPR-associated endonuclease/helicase Cas3